MPTRTPLTRAPRACALACALALLPACHGEGPAALAAEEIGALGQNPTIRGRDGGLSARLWGRSVWVFGDTVVTVEDVDGQTWHHNSISYTDDDRASDGIDGFVEPLDPAGAPRHLLEPTPAEAAYNAAHRGDPCAEEPCGARWATWPGTPVWDERGQRAYVFYGLIHAAPGDLNFEGVGTGIAVWTALDAPPERPVIHADAEHPDLLFGADEPSWGLGSTIVDDYLYTFGSVESAGHRIQLARVHLDHVLERGAWRFWDGDGWSTEWKDADDLYVGAPILSVSYNEHLGAWLSIYSAPFDSWVVARTAPELWGPWSRESRLYRAPEEDAPYDAVHHREFEEEGGKIQYLTYSRRTGEWFAADFALVRVEFE